MNVDTKQRPTARTYLEHLPYWTEPNASTKFVCVTNSNKTYTDRSFSVTHIERFFPLFICCAVQCLATSRDFRPRTGSRRLRAGDRTKHNTTQQYTTTEITVSSHGIIAMLVRCQPVCVIDDDDDDDVRQEFRVFPQDANTRAAFHSGDRTRS